ncbi:hypothetical protein CTI12_AA218180 [Artemisia annua]|uniref:DNA helicase Pif1-like 2B domain-containing protein n=1 Tax=Artemisia annua TaxID=35608 RepID=A0A2U1NXE5_ARTAN|nr:hypothetical protein CTI12_AA218180 [Artemisia annua]
MWQKVHSLRLYNAEKKQKHDNPVQAAIGSKKKNKQIEPVIIEVDMPAMCPRDRKNKSNTPSNPPVFEADTPTRDAQVANQPSSIESQHSHETTNIDCSNIQPQEGMYTYCLKFELWWRLFFWFGCTKNKNRKNNSSTATNPSVVEADTSTRHAQEFKGASLVGNQPTSDETQHGHEHTNINSSNFQTQDKNEYEESRIDVSYTRLLDNLWNHEVASPCEEVVDRIDGNMMRLIQGDETIYASSYSVSRDGSNTNLGCSIYITNFLNRIMMYNLSQHTIKLKIGSHVMLTQNIDRRAGLCIGTMLQVLRLGVNVIEAKIISGENADGEKCNHEYNFDVAKEEHQCFPFEDLKNSGITQLRDVFPHPMGRVFLDTSQSPNKLSNDVFPQINSSSNSMRNEGAVKYFLPIRSIDQLRSQIKFTEEENVRDEQTILGDKIHVIVNNGRLTFLEKYVKEDMVVLLRNFSVILNNTSYKYTKHPYKISYDGVATACRSNTFDADVNKIGFEFTKFCDIISLNLNTEIPVDIEGEVFSWERELRDYEVYGCKTKMLPIKLKDTLGINLTCLVIGVMAGYLLDYMKSTKNCNKFSMSICNARVYDEGKDPPMIYVNHQIGSTYEIFE